MDENGIVYELLWYFLSLVGLVSVRTTPLQSSYQISLDFVEGNKGWIVDTSKNESSHMTMVDYLSTQHTIFCINNYTPTLPILYAITLPAVTNESTLI